MCSLWLNNPQGNLLLIMNDVYVFHSVYANFLVFRFISSAPIDNILSYHARIFWQAVPTQSYPVQFP